MDITFPNLVTRALSDPKSPDVANRLKRLIKEANVSNWKVAGKKINTQDTRLGKFITETGRAQLVEALNSPSEELEKVKKEKPKDKNEEKLKDKKEEELQEVVKEVAKEAHPLLDSIGSRISAFFKILSNNPEHYELRKSEDGFPKKTLTDGYSLELKKHRDDYTTSTTCKLKTPQNLNFVHDKTTIDGNTTIRNESYETDGPTSDHTSDSITAKLNSSGQRIVDVNFLPKKPLSISID